MADELNPGLVSLISYRSGASDAGILSLQTEIRCLQKAVGAFSCITDIRRRNQPVVSARPDTGKLNGINTTEDDLPPQVL